MQKIRLKKKSDVKKMTSTSSDDDDGPDVSKHEHHQIHNEKTVVGTISWFDQGAEAASRLLLYIFQDVSGTV